MFNVAHSSSIVRKAIKIAINHQAALMLYYREHRDVGTDEKKTKIRFTKLIYMIVFDSIIQ